MTTRLAFLVSGLLAGGTVIAQSGTSVLVPPAAAGIEQAGTAAGPWGSGATSTRTLVVYDAASWTAAGVGGPITITGLRWRSDGGGSGGASTYGNVQVSLSTATTDHLGLSTSFAANHGGDLTLVRSGPVTVAAASGASPGSFYVQIVFTTPFVFDPTLGSDLAVDVQCDGTGWSGGAGAAADAAVGVGAGSMLTAASASATTGTVTSDSAPVLELATDWSGPAPTLVLNELVYQPIGPNREFVELYNASGGGISLAGWTLRATTASGTTTLATMPSVVLGAGQFYVVGNSVAPPPTLAPDLALAAALPDGNTTLTLRDAGGVVIDAVQYGGSAGVTPVFRGEGQPLFGAHALDPVSPTSWSRHSDGLDTGRNGVDFRVAPWTPKASNNLPSLLPYVSNFDALGIGQVVPSWSGSVAAPVAVEPGVLGTWNPKVVPASPQGGRCAAFCTPNDTAGGRSYLLLTDGTSQFGFRGLVYFDATLAPAGQSYAWSIGVCGTTDSDYAMPFPIGPSGLDDNGDTGVAWTYVVTDAVATLYLIGNGGGGTAHQVLAQHPIATSGWRSVQLDVCANRVFARYDGLLTQAPVADSMGGLFVAVRNQAPGAAIGALRMDDVVTDDGDRTGVVGIGSSCDGNCPPRNGDANVVDREKPTEDPDAKLETGFYAILVDAPDFLYRLAILTAPAKGLGSEDVTATLQLRTVAGSGAPGTAVLGSSFVLEDPDPDAEGDEWWECPAPGLTGQFFLEVNHDGTIELPIADETKDFEPELTADYYYRPDTSAGWQKVERKIAWSYRFSCSTTSSGAGGDQKGELRLGTTFTPTLDHAFPTTIGLLWLSFLQVPGIDLGFIGAPGCALWVDIAAGFGLATVTDAAGRAAIPILLANDPQSLGVQVFQQWFVLDPPANAFGWVSSNSLRTTIH